MVSDSVAELGGRLSVWLRNQALPFWSTVGLDGENGFVEHLNLQGRPADVSFKRLRVQARQIYVFSHAYLRGFRGGLDTAHNGWRFICDNAWTPSGNWARLLGRDGRILDATPDLYDHAFALFAIAWWIEASGDDQAEQWALRTLDAIDEHLSNPSGEGWLSEQRHGVLLQNPHMHLLEACLAAYAAIEEDRFLQCAASIVNLFERRFLDTATQTVSEYYDEDWRRLREDRGCVVEPGHSYEWAWLLAVAARYFPSAAAYVQPLFEFAEQSGCDPATGLVYDELWDNGQMRRSSHRLWPNTEAMKAHLAVYEMTGRLDSARLSQILSNLVRFFVGKPTPATWIDQLDDQNVPAMTKIPTSSLYHLHLAIAELERCCVRLGSVRGPAEGLFDAGR